MKNDLRVKGHGVLTEEAAIHNPGIALLTHPSLETDPMYRSLKTDLERYYVETKKNSENSVEVKKSTKSALYSNLHSLLSEVTYTKDQGMQKKMLRTVHNWYTNKAENKHKLPHIHSHNYTGAHHQHPAHPHPAHTTHHTAHAANAHPVSAHQSNLHSDSKTSNLSATPAIGPLIPGTTEVSTKADSYSPSPYVPRRYQSTDMSEHKATTESLNKKYIEMRNRDFFTEKESRSRHKVITAWGGEKSRANEDFVRKIEHSSMSGRSKTPASPEINQRNHSALAGRSLEHGNLINFIKPQEVEQEDVEEKLSRSRISKLRKMHAALLDVDAEAQLPKAKKHDSSMSFYRYKEDLDDSYSHKRNKSAEKFNEQIEEVILAKNKLASKNVPCHIRNLINGLVLAEEGARGLSPDALPRGGEYLINNPLIKLGKKKKKKGKKKKGKKKKT